MSNLIDAAERLQRAVDRLEKTVSKKSADDHAPGAPGLAEELSALRADHARLDAALRETEADRTDLNRVTATVSSRLDATIERLQSVLGK